jgi:hypothetical protein
MAVLFLWSILFLATLVWLCVRVWRSSPPLAIATFVFGPLGAAYTFVKERHNEETRVTLPFAVNLVFAALMAWSLWQMADKARREEQAQMVAAAAEAAAPAPVPSADDGLPADPFDRFVAQLRQDGLQGEITRLDPAGGALPRGVSAAAQLAVASPAGDGHALSGMVVRCANTHACQQLAGNYKAAGAKGEPARQVTQKGMMLLMVQPAAEVEGLHHVVQGVFRRTRF